MHKSHLLYKGVRRHPERYVTLEFHSLRDVEIHVVCLSVAVSVLSEDVPVEGAIHAHSCFEHNYKATLYYEWNSSEKY